MSAKGRPEREYRSAQREGTPMSDVRHAHPIVFMFLILPFGVMGGYLTVAVAYLLTQAGVQVEQVAALVAMSFIPHTWKFPWAPIADTTLSRKSWYLIACALISAWVSARRARFPPMASSCRCCTVVVVISNMAVTFLGMSVESLMVYGTAGSEKGRAGGWFQAGNLGGGGLGGGAGLWLAQNLPEPWIAGAVLGLACLLCCLALLFVHGAASRVFREGKLLAQHRRRGQGPVGRRALAGRLPRIAHLLPADRLWRGVGIVVRGGRRLARVGRHGRAGHRRARRNRLRRRLPRRRVSSAIA